MNYYNITLYLPQRFIWIYICDTSTDSAPVLNDLPAYSNSTSATWQGRPYVNRPWIKKPADSRAAISFYYVFFSLLYTSSPCHQSPPKIYACFNNLIYGFTMEHTTRSPGHNLHHAKGGAPFIIYRSVYYVYLFAITTYYVASISFGRILSCQYTLMRILWDRRAINVGERDIMF